MPAKKKTTTKKANGVGTVPTPKYYVEKKG